MKNACRWGILGTAGIARKNWSAIRNAQESRMIRRFSDLALAGEPDGRWSEYALKTQRILDAVLQSAQTDNRPVDLD